MNPSHDRIKIVLWGLCLLRFVRCTADRPRLGPVAEGWAGNSVNAVIFRQNAVVSYGSCQYTAFYDAQGHVILAKRDPDENEWTIRKTRYQGQIRDAHRCISIMTDGEGNLHMAWDHHDSPLRYCRSRSPGSLELTDELPMTGDREDRVTYLPSFTGCRTAIYCFYIMTAIPGA